MENGQDESDFEARGTGQDDGPVFDDPSADMADDPPVPTSMIDVPIRVRALGQAAMTLLGWVFWISLVILVGVGLRWLVGPAVFGASRLFMWAPLIIVVVLLIPVPIIQDYREARRVRRYVVEHVASPARDIAAGVFRKRRWFSETEGLKAFASRMATLGYRGTVFRYGRQNELGSVAGAAVTFEPRLIDETDEGFGDLLMTLDPSEWSRRAAPTPSLWRMMRRNIRLKEGRTSFWVTLLLLALAVANSYRRGGVTCSMAFWLTVLAFMLFRAPSSGERWFGLPGAAAIRHSLYGAMSYLTSRTAVLLIRQETRHRWRAVVSDGTTAHERPMTRVEIEALLACWISDVEPPPYERVAQALGVEATE